MRSPIRWALRRKEIAKGAPRRRELESELSQSWGHRVALKPAATKGGYDEVYYASNGGRRLAVIRVNSPFKQQNDPIGPNDPGVPLASVHRLEREWDAYAKLHSKNISPRPLWRTHDAIACSWLDWQRASLQLTKHRNQCWEIFERLIPTIRKMHDANVTHLDLNLGNVLIEPKGSGLAIIDFEFGPVDWVSIGQQMAFDYLRIVDDFTKPRRGGRQFLAAPERIVRVLDQSVPDLARTADMRFSLDKLNRLRDQPGLCTDLRSVFEGL